GDQIGRTRPQRSKTHAGLAGMPAIGRGHEACALFMPGKDQSDPGRAAEAVEHIEILLTGNPKDILDALLLKTLDEQIGCFGHDAIPLEQALWTMRIIIAARPS